MLRINPITNVNSTLNQPVFRAGVQTNYGVKAQDKKDFVESSLFSTFAGAIRNLISPEVKARADKIQRGLENTEKKIDAIA